MGSQRPPPGFMPHSPDFLRTFVYAQALGDRRGRPRPAPRRPGPGPLDALQARTPGSGPPGEPGPPAAPDAER